MDQNVLTRSNQFSFSLSSEPHMHVFMQAWEFLLMHWVEVRRWQDYKNFGSVNQDPIFKGNSVPNPEMGYPGCVPLLLHDGASVQVAGKQSTDIMLLALKWPCWHLVT